MTRAHETGVADGRLAVHDRCEDMDPRNWFNHRVITRSLRESDRAEYIAAFTSAVAS